MVQVENISFNYPGSRQAVFSDFSLTLRENNIYGLLGKNGTGKSTLLYLISGLLHARCGQVLVDGIDSRWRRPEMLREIFLLPEEFDLPSVSLQSYVRVNQSFYPHFSNDVLKACLRDFELDEDLNLGALSMGQKKKVYMSFAIATNTRLLLMDEPTNGLDIPSKAQFRRIVASHVSEERTLVISTHQVHDVEQLLDHVVMLDSDRLLLDSSVAELCDEYTFAFRAPGEPLDDVLYAEPSLQGNAVITRHRSGDAETPLNLELLFNYKTK